MYTYPTENKMKAVTEASPRPVADVSTISMISRFLLKYWPTIKVAGSLVIATPMPEKRTPNKFSPKQKITTSNQVGIHIGTR